MEGTAPILVHTVTLICLTSNMTFDLSVWYLFAALVTEATCGRIPAARTTIPGHYRRHLFSTTAEISSTVQPTIRGHPAWII